MITSLNLKVTNMDNLIDRDMAHVILMAFSVAEHEGMTSLVYSPKFDVEKGIQGRPEKHAYADAELRVLETLHALYPDITEQYFDLNKQPHRK